VRYLGCAGHARRLRRHGSGAGQNPKAVTAGWRAICEFSKVAMDILEQREGCSFAPYGKSRRHARRGRSNVRAIVDVAWHSSLRLIMCCWHTA
jgi:hypothetical protein